jgi:hypothetical protein
VLEKAGEVIGLIRAVVVLAALVLLTLLVIKHYGQDVQKAAAILGIAVPIFAAVVGGTLGYAAGQTTGQASGASKVKEEISGPVKEIAQHLQEPGGAAPPAAASEALGELQGVANV